MNETEIRQLVSPVARRIVNAENAFIDCVREITGCNEEQAVEIAAYYRKHKIVRYGASDGQFHIKHGVFMEPDVLLRALDA